MVSGYMSTITTAEDLTSRDKRLIFWASFLALTAAGVGFAFRVAKGGAYSAEFSLSNHEISQIFGATLWPIAITMIGFSLVVDRTGYKWPMVGAFILQAAAGIGTYYASSYGALYGTAICAGLGHGIVEAVINPVCAAIYPKQKTKFLTILHAAWPAGLVLGTLAIVMTDWLGAPSAEDLASGEVVVKDVVWRAHALWILLPAVAYLIVFLRCRMPVDERVQAGIPFSKMLRQVGFLGASLVAMMLVYELGNQYAKLSEQYDSLADWTLPSNWFYICIGVGIGLGALFGVVVKGIGKPLFFCMCLLMIPVAAAELGTDQFIGKLMRPVLENKDINPAMALVFSASIMLALRLFAGGILKHFTPPSLLALSGILSATGLFWLSSATGVSIFIAFALYALGQTYYWPCVLGFVSERYPEGGALTLNTVSAIGLLSVGIVGGQLIGIAFDESIHAQISEVEPGLAEASSLEKDFLWMDHEVIDVESKDAYISGLTDDGVRSRLETSYADADKQAGRDVLAYSVRFPLILVFAFGAIFLYFRSRGGYKPVEL